MSSTWDLGCFWVPLDAQLCFKKYLFCKKWIALVFSDPQPIHKVYFKVLFLSEIAFIFIHIFGVKDASRFWRHILRQTNCVLYTEKYAQYTMAKISYIFRIVVSSMTKQRRITSWYQHIRQNILHGTASLYIYHQAE